MRFDKDALIKHHFWILLGVFFILWLATVFMLKTSAADISGKAKKEFEAAKSGIDATAGKSPKNPSFNKPWVEYGETFKGQKEKVWSDAWNVQKDMFDWPSSPEFPLDRLKYPDDDIKWEERVEYRENLWKTQFQKLQAEVAPVEFRGGTSGFNRIMLPGFSGAGGGTGPVAAPQSPLGGAQQGGGLLSQRATTAVGQPQAVAAAGASNTVWDTFWTKVPTEEEMWLAQEDFWVKRELLRVVKDAVLSIARFNEVKPDDQQEPLPQGIAARHLFRNNLWEINFLLEREGGQWMISDRSTIKNLHPDQRTAPLSASPTSGGLQFAVKQGNRTFKFRVDGEPLPYEASAPFRKKWKVDSIVFTKPFQLEEVFETANSPVRQIMDLQLGKHAHRTAAMPLMTSLLIKPKVESAAAPAPAPATAAAGPKPAAGAVPAAAPAAAPAGSGEGDFTTNRLPRRRYLFRTDQVRHIPVALHLVVDQSHLHDVLAAMSNSRLRVQTTQVQYRHLSGFRPETVEGEPAGPASVREEDPNLLEVAVYGIASLYERFPPKPPATPSASPTPGATTAAAPAQPGATPGANPPAKTADAAKSSAPAGGTTPPGKQPEAAKAAAPAGNPPTGPEAGKATDPSKAPPAAKPAGAGKATGAPGPATPPTTDAKSNATEPKKP